MTTKNPKRSRGMYTIDLDGDGKRVKEYPSVTTILSKGVVKPALMGWATKLVQAQAIKAAGTAFEIAGASEGRGTFENRVAEIIKHDRRADRNESKKAMAIGSQVHSLIESALRVEMNVIHVPPVLVHIPPVFSVYYPETQRAFDRWCRWRKKQNFKPVFVEQVVWSEECEYAGTLDLLAEYPDGKQVVWDWKVSSGIYPEALAQNAAYLGAVVEMGHAKEKKITGGVLRLDKTENPESEWNEHRITIKESIDNFDWFLTILRAVIMSERVSDQLL